jgi:P-type Ca2+ transporter type 2C
MPLSVDKVQDFLTTAYEIGRKGLRVVGMAKGNTLQELTYMGLVGICDPPRPLVREAIQMLMGSGVEVKLVTGDAQETAIAIGISLIQ